MNMVNVIPISAWESSVDHLGHLLTTPSDEITRLLDGCPDRESDLARYMEALADIDVSMEDGISKRIGVMRQFY